MSKILFFGLTRVMAAHCLSMRSLPNHLEDYGFTFYNEVAAYGDCCRGPIVFISPAERQHIAEHLEGILPHMSQEGQFVVKESLRQKGPEHKHEAFAESARGVQGEQQGQELDFAKMHTIWGDQCIFWTLHHDGLRGQVRCAIHAYTVQAGLSYLDINLWTVVLATGVVPLYTGQFLLRYIQKKHGILLRSQKIMRRSVASRSPSPARPISIRASTKSSCMCSARSGLMLS